MNGRYLLDTHVLLWSLVQPENLSDGARMALFDESSALFVSAVSGYEIALKHSLGKLPVGERVLDSLGGALSQQSLHEMPVTMKQSVAAGRLPLIHRDPFDRLLAAQAIDAGVTLISADTIFDQFGVPRFWH